MFLWHYLEPWRVSAIGYSHLVISVDYPPTLTQLTNGNSSSCTASAAQACLMYSALASGVKSGFAFTYSPDTAVSPLATYTIHADPLSRGTSGRRSFRTDQPGVIRFNPAGAATVSDPPIPM